MLNAKAFANATSAVMAVWFIGCALLSYVMPDLLFSIGQSWMHTISLESVKTAYTPGLSSILIGFVSAIVLTWITVYATAVLYNKLARK